MTAAEVIRRYSTEPFAWGRSDCCTFVGECLAADGHADPMQHFRYQGEKAARNAIGIYGDLEAAITAWLGAPADDIAPGDVALVRYGAETIAGYVCETMAGLRVVVRTEKGLTDWPASRALRNWRPA